MTHSFATYISRGICAMILCAGLVLSTYPMSAIAQTGTTASGIKPLEAKGTTQKNPATGTTASEKGNTTGGIQNSVNNTVSSAGRGLGDIAEGFSSVRDATTSVTSAAGAFGVGGLKDVGNTMNSINNQLDTGQTILGQAGKLTNTDFSNMFNQGTGSFSFSGAGKAFSSALSGVGTTLGNKWDAAKKIDVSGLYKDVTNYFKDMTPDIKGLNADELMKFDFSSFASLFPEKGVLGILVDLEPLGITSVITTEITFVSKEAQLSYEQEYTTSLGPIGTMDGRMGLCVVNGHDYTGMIRAFLAGPGKQNEGDYPWLHLDTNCWATIGIGTVLTQRGKSYEAMKTYFMSMDYEPKSVQQAEFDKIYAMQQSCLTDCAKNGRDSKGRCINKLESEYRPLFQGRLTAAATQDVAIAELCEDHIKLFITRYMTQSGGNYAALPIEHQIVLLDMSYQRPRSITNDPGAAQMRSALIAKNCSAAVSGFNQGNLAKEFANRATWRRSALMSPCGGGGI